MITIKTRNLNPNLLLCYNDPCGISLRERSARTARARRAITFALSRARPTMHTRACRGLRMWSMGSPLSIVDCFIAGRSWSRADTLPIRIALPPRQPLYQDRKDYALTFVSFRFVSFRDSGCLRCFVSRLNAPILPAREDRAPLPRRSSAFLCNAMIYAIHFSVCHANVERRTEPHHHRLLRSFSSFSSLILTRDIQRRRTFFPISDELFLFSSRVVHTPRSEEYRTRNANIFNERLIRDKGNKKRNRERGGRGIQREHSSRDLPFCRSGRS